MTKPKAPCPPAVAAAPVPHGIFRNAIMESDMVNVNIGYLALFWLLGLDVVLSVITVLAGFVMQWFHPMHEYPFTGVAAALAAVWGTFSTALAALGLFLVGDRRPMPPSTTVALTQTTVP